MKHIVTVALGAVLALSACSRQDEAYGKTAPDTKNRTTAPATPAPSTSKQTPPPSGSGNALEIPPKPTPAAPSNQGDALIAQEVRNAIKSNANLSSEAQTVNVASLDGVVTLTGSVNSVDEKAEIESIATAIAGVTRVDNQIEVKSGK